MKKIFYAFLFLAIGNEIFAQSWLGVYDGHKSEPNTKGYIVRTGGKFGLCGKDGNELIPCMYDFLTYAGGSFKVGQNGLSGLCSSDGYVLIPCMYSNIIVLDRYILVEKNGKKGIFSPIGDLLVPCEYEEIIKSDSMGGLFYVRNNKQQGLYSMQGVEVVPCKYDDVYVGKDGVRVIKDGKYGFYNYIGINAIPCEYDYVNLSRVGAKVKKDGKQGLYSKDGDVLVPCEYDFVKVTGDNVQVCKNGEWSNYRIKPDGEGRGNDYAAPGKNSSVNNDEMYAKYVDEAERLFDRRKWKQSQKKYELAALYKETYSVNYNIAACMYNRNKYRDAINYYSRSLNYDHSQAQDERARKMIEKSQEAIQRRSEAMAELGTAILGTIAVTSAAMLSASAQMTMPQPGYAPPSTYQYGDGADAAIANANRIMQQSQQRMQYEMATAPQQLMQVTMQQMAAQEAAKEAQMRQNYEAYKKNPGYMLNEDGSLLTWEQYKARCLQMEAEAYMQLQQEESSNNQETTGSSGEIQRKKVQTRTTVSDCSVCHGTGDCNTCGGDGWMDDMFGLGDLKCTTCFNINKGKCKFCGGTGKNSKTKVVYE